MKKIITLLVIGLTLFITNITLAAIVTKSMTTTWTYDTTEEVNIAGFRILNQDLKVVADNIGPKLRTNTVNYTYDDTVAQSFSIISFSADGKTSLPSNSFILPVKFKPLIGVGTIKIEFKDVVQ